MGRVRSARRVVALDVGSHSVKLVAARRTASGATHVEAVAQDVLPPGVLHGYAVRHVAAVADVVRRLVRVGGLVRAVGRRARRVVTAVPAPAVVMRRLVVPAAAAGALDATVAREAATLLPDAVDQAVLDYHVLGPVEGGRLAVLVVAARRDLVQGYTGAVRGAGLEPSLVDVDVFALERLHDGRPTGAPVALIHVGARQAMIAVLRDDGPAFAGDVPADGIDGEALALAVARALDLFSPDPARSCASARLSGGGATRPGLAGALADRLGCPVEVVDPFAGVRLGARVDRAALDRRRPAFAVAVGLAHRGLVG